MKNRKANPQPRDLTKRSRGVRYLTESEIQYLRHGPPEPDLEQTIELANGIAEVRAALAQRGFSLLEMTIAMSVAAILATVAVPSLLMHTQLMALQSTVNSFKWSAMRVPALPLDPSWHQTLNTFTKTMTRPVGTLSITQPSTVGGAWVCTFSDPSYVVRC